MKRLLVLALALPISACSAGGFQLPSFGFGSSTRPDTQPLTQPIAQVAQAPISNLGTMNATNLMDGRTISLSARAYGNGARVTESNGCTWTRANDWFSPSDSWANCGDSRNWHTGQATVRQLDSLYPLQVGSVGRYERLARSHTGRSYTRQTRCEVTDAVEVLRPAHGATPAYVVECDDTSRTRTTWYAPSEGPIAYRETHHRNGLEEAWVRTD